MIINVGAEFSTHLESSDDAVELIDILNKIPEETFIIDFKDVIFVTIILIIVIKSCGNAKYLK